MIEKLHKFIISNPAISVLYKDMQPSKEQILTKDIIKQKAILEEINSCIESLQSTKQRLKDDIQALYIKKEELKHDVSTLNREISSNIRNIETVRSDTVSVFNINGFFSVLIQGIISKLDIFSKVEENRKIVEDEINRMRENALLEINEMKTRTEESVSRTKRTAERELSLLQRQKDYISKEINDLLQKYIEAKRAAPKDTTSTVIGKSSYSTTSTTTYRAGVLQR